MNKTITVPVLVKLRIQHSLNCVSLTPSVLPELNNYNNTEKTFPLNRTHTQEKFTL